MSFRPLRAELDLKNLRHNYRVLRDIIGFRQFFCPMLKANAYGHGDVECARALLEEGANYFGVALIEEGVRLRERLSEAGILIFQPFADKLSAEAAVTHRLTPVVSSWQGVHALESAVDSIKNAANISDFNIHLKFNTGMSRLGFPPSEAKKLADYFSKNPKLNLEGVCTHLLNGEDALREDGRTREQLEIFSKIFEFFESDEIFPHVLNSSACLARFLQPENSSLKFCGARPGISLYGVKAPVASLSSELESCYEKIELRPVMRVIGKVVHVQKLANGETVSYGGRFQAKRESTIGVVPVGYADGYMRRLSSKSNMICRGQRVPVVGTVCMDFTMVDLTDVDASVGDEVIVLGSQKLDGRSASITAQELADLAGTNAYEILTNFSARVPRVYV